MDNGTGLSVSDALALRHDNALYGGYGYPMGGYQMGYPYHKGHSGAATTAIGLGAGLGGAALIAALVGMWGVNSASKSRSRAAEQISAANARTTELLAQKNADSINTLSAALLNERSSREAWQRYNQPGIGQYVDVQTNPSLNSTVQDIVSAMASAQATANNNSGINSAVGTEPYLRVQHFSAPQPCGCPGCNGGY